PYRFDEASRRNEWEAAVAQGELERLQVSPAEKLAQRTRFRGEDATRRRRLQHGSAAVLDGAPRVEPERPSELPPEQEGLARVLDKRGQLVCLVRPERVPANGRRRWRPVRVLVQPGGGEGR